MSGSCKHQKRCGLSWLRFLYIFLNKIYLKKIKKLLDLNSRALEYREIKSHKYRGAVYNMPNKLKLRLC